MINKGHCRLSFIQKYIVKHQNIVYSAIRASSENSQVYQVHLKDKEYVQKVAIKVYGQHCGAPSNLALLLNKDLNHIVKIFDYKQQMPAYMRMQLCEQDLKESLLRQKDKLNVEEKLRYIRQIASGLYSLKLLKLMHGDLKPQNILIDTHNTLKIADVDYVLREDEFESKKIRMGTLPYMAPQVMTHWSCSYASDIWSLGVVIYQIYFGRTLFAMLQKLDPRKQDSFKDSMLIIKQRLEHTRAHIKNCIKQQMDSNSILILQAMLQCLVWSAASRGKIQDLIGSLQGGKGRRKCSQSTDYSTTLHYQDDLFILPNTSLLMAFQKLNTILSYLPQEANKFKDIIQKIKEIQNETPTEKTIKTLKQLIELKYQKMKRVFQRLSKIEGGVDYSKKGQLFQHLAYMIQLLEQGIQSSEWAKQNSAKSAQLL